MNYSESEIKNMVVVTHQLLDRLKVRVNRSTLFAKINSHPQFPGLAAIQDCLTDLKIDNNSYEIDKNQYGLSDLEYPFIAYVPEGKDKFVLVDDFNEGMVRISSDKKEYKLISEKDFLARWEGIMLFASSNEKSGELNFYQNYIKYFLKKAVLPVFCTTLIFVFVMIYMQTPFQWPVFFLFLLNFLGLSLSILLLMQSMNLKNTFISKVCKLGGESSCEGVLQSRAANITSWLSWSELGFFYFSGSFLTILLFPVFVPVLTWMNILAIPFTFYSIKYQYKMKIWCLICCAVQGVLILEYLIFVCWIKSFNVNFIPGFYLLLSFFLCFLIPLLVWILQKQLLLKFSLVKLLEKQLKFKYNIELFNVFLMNQRLFQVSKELIPIVLGNTSSETVITIVSNPFCKACGEAHNVVEDWLLQRNDFQVKLIFSCGYDEHSYATKVVQHLIALSLAEDKKIVLNALNDWYKTENGFELWAERYPAVITHEIKSAFANQRRWCEHNEISYTPAILVNGYMLQEPYHLEDLKYLI